MCPPANAQRVARGRACLPAIVLEEALKQVQWRGRFQRLRGDRIILDGAHNPEAAAMPLTSPVGSPQADAQAGRTHQGIHVLVVEDDATIAAVICGMLESEGLRVTHAAHGLAALAALGEAGIDIALMDLDLPGIDGLQLARMIREREREGSTHLPIIAITARATGDEEAQTRAAGMDGFLRKPITLAMLQTALRPWREPS